MNFVHDICLNHAVTSKLVSCCIYVYMSHSYTVNIYVDFIIKTHECVPRSGNDMDVSCLPMAAQSLILANDFLWQRSSKPALEVTYMF